MHGDKEAPRRGMLGDSSVPWGNTDGGGYHHVVGYRLRDRGAAYMTGTLIQLDWTARIIPAMGRGNSVRYRHGAYQFGGIGVGSIRWNESILRARDGVQSRGRG